MSVVDMEWYKPFKAEVMKHPQTLAHVESLCRRKEICFSKCLRKYEQLIRNWIAQEDGEQAERKNNETN